MTKHQEFPLIKYFNPVHLGLFSGGTALLFMIVGKAWGTSGLLGGPTEFPWITSCAFILLYMIFSSFGSVMSEHIGDYWKKAVPIFALLMAVNSGMAYLFSSAWITEVGSFKYIYILLIFAYLVMQSMTRLISWVLSYASADHEANG